MVIKWVSFSKRQPTLFKDMAGYKHFSALCRYATPLRFQKSLKIVVTIKNLFCIWCLSLGENNSTGILPPLSDMGRDTTKIFHPEKLV